MSKYAPLGAHLRESGRDEIAMTFGKIQTVIGESLPESAYRHQAWWSNNPSNNPMTRVWLEAGYETLEVNMDGRRLRFRKASV